MKTNKLVMVLAGLGSMFGAAASHAVVSTADVVSAISTSLGPAEAVGVAIVVAYAGIFAFKLIKRLL